MSPGGGLRDRHVKVGRHIPPDPDELKAYLDRFIGGSHRQAPVEAAQDHRRGGGDVTGSPRIHPFLDGNGRVTRLFVARSAT